MDGTETDQTRQSAGRVPKVKPAHLTGGSRKGIPNKTTTLLKDAIIEAATKAGGKAGLVGYLQTQAIENPGPFMTLVGKVLPLQMAGDGGAQIVLQLTSTDERL